MSDELAIMVAATSDPEFKVRLGALREEQAKIKEHQAEYQKLIEQNAALVRQAQEERLKAAAILSQAQEHKRQGDVSHERAATAYRAVRDEQARFDAGRTLVDQQHTEREKSLSDREAAITRISADLRQRETRLIQRENAAATAEARHAAAHKHAAAFVAALDAPGR